MMMRTEGGVYSWCRNGWGWGLSLTKRGKNMLMSDKILDIYSHPNALTTQALLSHMDLSCPIKYRGNHYKTNTFSKLLRRSQQNVKIY